jgi:hypothetical protein
MPDPAPLERRVAELEREVQALRGRSGGVRYRSAAALGGVPLLAVSLGPDLSRGELRGHARGVVALGDFATGVIAIGGIARGFLAIGGLALGVLGFGGLSLGLLAAVGGLAIGSLAVGGFSAGGAAVGGGAVGYYACGGAARGAYVVSQRRRDPEAIAFFEARGLGGLCLPR